MLISAEYQYVFLCTPKCASSSIEAMLKPYSDIALLRRPAFRHTNYREYNQYIKPYLKEKAGVDRIETVCLIREPLSWLNSWYRFRARLELRNSNNDNHNHSTFGIQFSEFIEAYMSPHKPSFADVGSQFSFIKDNMNKIGVDKVFIYEQIDDFVEYMSRKVGKKLTIGKENVSTKRVYPSNFAQWAYNVEQKISSKFNLDRLSIASEGEYKISEDLFCSLKKFMSDDFELYETLKNSQKH